MTCYSPALLIRAEAFASIAWALANGCPRQREAWGNGIAGGVVSGYRMRCPKKATV